MPRPLSLTVGFIYQTVDAVIGRLVTVGLTDRSVVRGCPAAGWRGLHHAERGVGTHVEVDVLACTATTTAGRVHFLRRSVPFSQRGRRVLDLLVHLVTGFSLGRAAAAAHVAANDAAAVPRVLRVVFFPATTPESSVMVTCISFVLRLSWADHTTRQFSTDHKLT